LKIQVICEKELPNVVPIHGDAEGIKLLVLKYWIARFLLNNVNNILL
jgi:hypothetical protein